MNKERLVIKPIQLDSQNVYVECETCNGKRFNRWLKANRKW